MIKVLTIGDIHGRKYWKDYLFDGDANWAHVLNDIENGWPIREACADLPVNNFHKIIFVGDYVDSFNVRAPFQLNNLHNILN